MPSVTCLTCGQSFQAERIGRSRSEFCPHCGSLNDLGPEDFDESNIDPIEPSFSRPPGLSTLTRIVMMLMLIAFAVACYFILRPSWEERNFPAIRDLVVQGESELAEGHFQSASTDFSDAMNRSDGQEIHSIYFRAVLARAKQGEEIARRAMHPATTTAP